MPSKNVSEKISHKLSTADCHCQPTTWAGQDLRNTLPRTATTKNEDLTAESHFMDANGQ
jgi:hypothetical protein